VATRSWALAKRDGGFLDFQSMIFPENRLPPRVKHGAGHFGIMSSSPGAPRRPRRCRSRQARRRAHGRRPCA
jgi:hypothetical protein